MEQMVHKPYDLELELKSCDWIIKKVKSDDAYAQNLYAALCNNEFIKNEVLHILREDTWYCSWRYAGGIIADMKGYGDYLDYYCTGMTNVTYDTVEDEKQFRKKQYVHEGYVTDEIKKDLVTLGWIVHSE